MATETYVVGDGLISAIAHTRLFGAFQKLAPTACTDECKREIVKLFNERNQVVGIDAVDFENEKDILSGSAVFIKPKLEEFILALNVDVKEIRNALQERAKNSIKFLNEQELTVSKCSAIMFFDGFFSISMYLETPNGWSNGNIESSFSPQNRDFIAQAYMSIMTDIVQISFPILKSVIQNTINRHVSFTPRNQVKWLPADSVKVEDSHILFAGMLEEDYQASVPLSERYRPLVYSQGPDPLVSQSSNLNEFLRLDFAFDIFATTSKEDLRRRVDELTLLIRTQQFIYYRLASVSDELESLLQNRDKLDLDQMYDRWIDLRNSYSKYVSPTFTFRYDFLVMSDVLRKTWFIDRLLIRVNELLDDITTIIDRLENIRRRRSDQIIQYALLAIAILSALRVLSHFNLFGF